MRNEKELQSPDQIGEHLRVTAVPTYLLATAAFVLLAAFIVWGFLGNVSDNEPFEAFDPIVSVIDGTGTSQHIAQTHLMPGMSAIVTLE